MGWLEHYFKVSGVGEQRVCCPFHEDMNASASINLDKRLFNCAVCEKGFTETQLTAKLENISYTTAVSLVNLFKNSETRVEWLRSTQFGQESRALCSKFNISEEVARQLGVADVPNTAGTMAFPVFYRDHLIDVRTYHPAGTPKMKSRKGSPCGFLIPQEIDKTRIVILCAGEKDMATTRSHGFNAYCLTGGEKTLPANPEWFKDAVVVVAYDNDDAGRAGADKLAAYIEPYCKQVKVLTKFHEVCVNKGEDLTDFWNKYKMKSEDLIRMIKETDVFVPTEEIKVACNHTLKTLEECSEVDNINRTFKSVVQVTGNYDQTFVIPTSFTVEKIKECGNDTLVEGEVREWELNENNVRDILLLCDNNITDDTLRRNSLFLAGVKPSEPGIRIHRTGTQTVTKATIYDKVEYTMYLIGDRVDAGKQYTITHKLVTNPNKGQQLTSVATKAEPVADTAEMFTITDEVKNNLQQIRDIPGGIVQKIDTMAEKVKCLLGYNGNNQLITTIDLAYHTPLYFNFGAFKNVRAYLDTLIVGESRVGKSSTAQTLKDTYELGEFVSLAGNSATIPALIGGTQKLGNGTSCTKAGVIPQTHKGLVIFEEFGKCDKNVTAELTDIRSSNEVRIQRVSGNLTLPAVVRMITLSNVKPTSNGDIRAIESYPNGLAIATELVPTAEDIARYDIVLISSDKGNNKIDPLWEPQKAFSKEVYKDRIRWVWSRTAEQIIFTDAAKEAVVRYSNTLNTEYDCHIKLFGTECWKKLCRIAIATAGYTVSTDDTFENIIVDKQHVAYAAKFLKELYDNDTFRLKEYVNNERKYIDCDDKAVEQLQEIFIAVPQLLIFLEENAQATKSDLDVVIGLSKEETSGFQSVLVRGAFITLHGSTWRPTVRFRKAMRKINREASLRKLTE